MPNALATSASPYLKQHADNPVAWQPWGESAFAEARRRDVPVLVSIGYSTCHWCHVMAHESFEDAQTAALMNAHFVCIKVDREEHPEVDAIYMDAVQALTGHGGWPLNAFTDADGRPFHALTYLPRPAWRKLLDHLAALWAGDRARIAKAAEQITAHLQDAGVAPGALPADLWSGLEQGLARAWDGAAPGWAYGEAKAPKFPSSQVLPLLLDSGRAPVLRQAELVLEAMQDAGLHERVGGGFHRYSVDRHWRLPHFEKMLYDNAQLIVAYARAGAALGRPDFTRTAVNAGDYLLRDLRVVEDGVFRGYASAEDADDPDGEGSFYAWPPAELAAALGAATGAALAAAWDITPGTRPTSAHGHLEPIVSHIPHPRGTALARLAPDGDVQALRASWEVHLPVLRARRAARPRPGRDDKVLTDQNALALEAFAALGRHCGDERGEARFTAACSELAAVLMARHHADGLIRLPGAAGQPARPAYITDYGALVTGLCAAFDLLGEPALIDAAERVADEAWTRLHADDGGFYTTPAGRTDLVRRGREQTDNAWPSGQNSLALGCVRLAALTGTGRWRALAEGVFSASAAIVAQAPSACATLLRAAVQARRGALIAVVAGAADDPATVALLATCRRATLPGLVIVPLATCRERAWACLDGRRDIDEAQVMLCIGTTCLLPARDPEALTLRLVEAGRRLAERRAERSGVAEAP